MPATHRSINTQNGKQELSFIDVNFTTHRWYWTSGNDSVDLVGEIIVDSICYKCFLMGNFNFGTELMNQMKFSIYVAVTARAA